MVALVLLCIAIVIVTLILWMRRESTILVRYLGDSLRELEWVGSKGTRSYMLMYIPLECRGYCALVRAWIFTPEGECPDEGVITVSAGLGTATCRAPYVRLGPYCDLGAFIVVANSPLRLSWKGIEAEVKGDTGGRAEISGSLVVVATKSSPERVKGWTSAKPPCRAVLRMMVKEVSVSPYTLMLYVEAEEELRLVIESGADKVEIKPFYLQREKLLVSGVVIISAPGKVSIRC